MSVVDEAKAAGFTHVRTSGGLVPLDGWRPYGVLPFDTTRATFVFTGDAIDDVSTSPVRPGEPIGGRWRLERIQGVRRYCLSSTGTSSAHLGNCEVCKKPAPEVWHQVEEREYPGGWTQAGCHNLFGHSECLLAQRSPDSLEVKA